MDLPNIHVCGTAEAKPAPKFETYRIADISTVHITKEDGQLISQKDLPGHIASLDEDIAGEGAPGEFFAVFTDAESFENMQVAGFKRAGLSEAFINIFRHLHYQQIPYVRIDADGAYATNLPEFEW